MANPTESNQLNDDEYNNLKEDKNEWSTIELKRRWKSLKMQNVLGQDCQ